MKILNHTLRPQGFLLAAGWLSVEPMSSIEVTDTKQEKELKEFFTTASGKALLDSKALSIDSGKETVDSPTEMPHPKAPKRLRNHKLTDESKVGESTSLVSVGSVSL